MPINSASAGVSMDPPRVTGWPVRTLLRGQTVMENGAPVGAAIGRHIARDKVAA